MKSVFKNLYIGGQITDITAENRITAMEQQDSTKYTQGLGDVEWHPFLVRTFTVRII